MNSNVWVKASERLPKVEKHYFIKGLNCTGWKMFKDGKFNINSNDIVYYWLDEQHLIEVPFEAGIKKDDSLINHIRNIKLLQDIHKGNKFFVECFPTDIGAQCFPNSNFAVKEIELPNFDLYEEKLGYKWQKEVPVEDVDKAAQDFADENYPKGYTQSGNGFRNEAAIPSFKAGAEWQKQQSTPINEQSKIDKAIEFEKIAIDVRKRCKYYNDDIFQFKEWFQTYLQSLKYESTPLNVGEDDLWEEIRVEFLMNQNATEHLETHFNITRK